jgi:hypothetical protein
MRINRGHNYEYIIDDIDINYNYIQRYYALTGTQRKLPYDFFAMDSKRFEIVTEDDNVIRIMWWVMTGKIL